MRKTVGVYPPVERERRARLFGALEDALPVRFEGRGPDELSSGLDAVILFEEVARPSDLRSFAALETSRSDLAGEVELGASPPLDARLRGRSLVDGRADGLRGLPVDGAAVLAACGDSALWTRAGAADRVASAPDELGPEESLRDVLAPGRWLSHLPLIHFLRDVAGDVAWQGPPTRASFVIDDPNLHWRSYGHVRFSEVARGAARDGYHVGFGTIPLDAWLVHPGVARLFRESPQLLSLIVHGNNHVREELNTPRTEREAFGLLGQALRRVAALERRAGVSVSRVMIAPHGLCDEQMMRALLLSGFEGLCYSYPARRSAERPLADWWPADIRVGGLPVFPRLPVTSALDDLVFRSFLGQPLILYGHHADLAGGLDALAGAAAFVNREEGVRWTSLTDIARSSYLTLRDGATLRVRPFARTIEVAVPGGVDEIVVELPPSYDDPEPGPFPVAEPGRIEISLERVDAMNVAGLPSPPRRLHPVLRRAATETRDRVAPLVAAVQAAYR